MINKAHRFLLVSRNKDGTYFVPCPELQDESSVWARYGWMCRGRNYEDDWRVLEVTPNGWALVIKSLVRSYPSFEYKYESFPLTEEVVFDKSGWKPYVIPQLLEEIETLRKVMRDDPTP